MLFRHTNYRALVHTVLSCLAERGGLVSRISYYPLGRDKTQSGEQ